MFTGKVMDCESLSPTGNVHDSRNDCPTVMGDETPVSALYGTIRPAPASNVTSSPP